MNPKHEVLSVVLEADELEWMRETAERDGKSLSAVVGALIRQAREAEEECARRRDSWIQVCEWALEGLDPEERERARRALDDVRS